MGWLWRAILAVCRTRFDCHGLLALRCHVIENVTARVVALAVRLGRATAVWRARTRGVVARTLFRFALATEFLLLVVREDRSGAFGRLFRCTPFA